MIAARTTQPSAAPPGHRGAPPRRRSLLAAAPPHWPFTTDRGAVLLALARLSPACDRDRPADPRLVARCLLDDRRGTGTTADAIGPVAGSAVAVAWAWLALKDSKLWHGLHGAGGDGLGPEALLELIELCRLIRSHGAADRRLIRAYAASWPGRGKLRLADMLARLHAPAEMCLFLASYKPSGFVPAPPFALAAEILLTVALPRRWPA